jgi:hypothetical protein
VEDAPMIWFRAGWWVLLASVVFLAPTRGASPRVTLRLENATCEEAALALTRATGVSVEVIPLPADTAPGSVELPVVPVNKPARFDWNDVTLAQALRDLGEHYSLRPSARSDGGYVLVQQPTRRPAPRYAPLARTELRGMQLQVQSVRVDGSYPAQDPGERLLLQLHGRALAGDAEAVVNLEDVFGRDDRGGVLVGQNRFSQRVDRGYPDEWTASLPLTGLQPGAKRLELLEGTLIAAPILRILRNEVPLPLPASGARRQLGERTVEFRALIIPQPLLFVHASERQSGGPQLQMHVVESAPPGPPLLNAEGDAVPVLVGASGRIYKASSTNRRGTQIDGQRIYDTTLRFPVIDEPIRQVRVAIAERREPRALGTFRIRNIPLPTGKPVPPGSLSFAALQSTPLTPESLDYDGKGGTLVSPVEVNGQPAARGRLSLGLSAAGGASATRWYHLETGTQSPALLPHVRPGAYRVLRVYQSFSSETRALAGWWRNDEVLTRVEAGKEVKLPPLQLTPTPPAPAPVQLPARVEGMEATVDRANLAYTRTLELLAPPETRDDGTLTLDLSGAVGGVETSRLFGLSNVIARDERGGLLTQRHGTRLITSSAGDFQGLKWSQSISLNSPHSGARFLRWVEGDLMAFSRGEQLEADVPLPCPVGGVRKPVGPLQLEVDSLEEMQPEAIAGQPAPERQYLLRGRFTASGIADLTNAQGQRTQPRLIGRSGTSYPPVRTFDSVGSSLWEFRCRYLVREPVVRISFQLTARTGLEPIASFRLLRVPLPDARPFVPPMANPQAVRRLKRSIAGEARLAAFEQVGGADLVLPVRLEDRRTAEGSLSVGLSAQTPRGWGPLRWVEVELVDGAVLLRDLKPGTYCLYRSYRAAEPSGQPHGGRWTGTDVQVSLVAGKVSTVPPLTWRKQP